MSYYLRIISQLDLKEVGSYDKISTSVSQVSSFLRNVYSVNSKLKVCSSLKTQWVSC